MATIQVDDRAMDKVIAKMKTLDNIMVAMAPDMRDIQDMLFKDAREQPRKAAGAFTKLATPGQRKAYWAKVKSGEARNGPNGYIRSGKTFRGWKKSMRLTAHSIQIDVYNDADGVQFVHGKRRQPFHRVSGWKTDTEMAREHSRVVRKKVNAAIHRIITR